jgi:hypothetical protein
VSDGRFAAGIYTYPWDLAAEGHDLALGRIAGAGLTAVNLASAYHAGKFVLPHNPRHRVYFAEDGALYFRPNLTRYGRLQPRVSSLVDDDDDPLTALDRARREHRLDLVAWVVCLHNTWLGERFPECAVQNAFGDPSPHSLCPADSEVRGYLKAVLTDLLSRAEVAAVQFESPGYMSFIHGFHHEIIGVPLDDGQQTLLALSFHPAELDRARAAGIDGERLRERVAAALDTSWGTSSGGETVAAVLASPELAAYQALQRDIVVELVGELRETVKAVSPETAVRLFAALGPAEGSEERDTRLLDLADGVLTGYASSDDDAVRRADELTSLVAPRPVYGMVRAIAPDTVDPAQIAPRVAAWRGAGVAGIDVYNYGLMTLPTLDALGAALNGA